MYITQHRYSIERLPEATMGGGMYNFSWSSHTMHYSTQIAISDAKITCSTSCMRPLNIKWRGRSSKPKEFLFWSFRDSQTCFGKLFILCIGLYAYVSGMSLLKRAFTSERWHECLTSTSRVKVRLLFQICVYISDCYISQKFWLLAIDWSSYTMFARRIYLDFDCIWFPYLIQMHWDHRHVHVLQSLYGKPRSHYILVTCAVSLSWENRMPSIYSLVCFNEM